jgi:DNA-binding FadR family transcriptional regulator
MAVAPEATARRKRSHEVFDRLKSMITSGECGPGDAMPSERDLMDRFGVGRPVIREAMQALANIGLISISHGERARVQQLSAKSIVAQVELSANILLSASPDSLESLKQARRFFEGGMARQAAERATDADVARLAETLHLQEESVDDPAGFIAADVRFHTQIAAISANPIFTAVSEAMLGWLRQYHVQLLRIAGKENLTLSEHRLILEHIGRNDPDAAEAMMVQHLDRSSVLYTHPV